MGPWIFSKPQGLLVERHSVKTHFEKCPSKTKYFQETGKPPNIIIVYA